MKKSLNTAFLGLLTLGALLAAPAAMLAQTLCVDTAFGLVDKVSSTGAVSLFATLPAGSGPQGVAFDGSGNLYVVDGGNAYQDQISKITPGGAMSFFVSLPAGSGPIGLAIDPSDNLYAADYWTSQISKITPDGAVSLFATLPSGSYPLGLTIDANLNLYAALGGGHNQISKITPDGVVSFFATLPIDGYPIGLAFDTSGNLYVAGGQASNQIRKVTPDGTVSPFATVSGPQGLAFDGSGNLYAAATGTNEIVKITPDGLTVSTFASGISSPYFIAIQAPYSAQVQQPINPGGSSVFSVRRGVVPVKFTLTLNGVATCDLPPATISLTRTAGTVLGSIDEGTYLMSSDSGSNFRIDSCQYVYNLSTSSLGTGTYKVNITIGGIVVGSGTFSLK